MRVVAFERHGGPDVLTVQERPQPEPGPGEVLIAVRAVVVGPGDCKLRAGMLRRHFEVPLPKIPGRYGAGTIAAVGPGGDPARIGQSVVFSTLHTESGACAEFVVRAQEKAVPAPAGMSAAETAAMIQGGVCAYTGLLEVGSVRRGARILVHGGAGAVGSAAVRLGSHLGTEVTATCRVDDREFVQALGARRVVAYDREDFASVVSDQDLVFDTLGGDTHRRSYPVLKRGGTLVYLNADPIEDRGAEFGVRVLNARIDDRPEILSAVCRLAAAGVFVGEVGRALPLEAAAEAHRLVESGQIRRRRVVLTLD